jgi:hypothetical protein
MANVSPAIPASIERIIAVGAIRAEAMWCSGVKNPVS